jgi:HK97 family phage portal protein
MKKKQGLLSRIFRASSTSIREAFEAAILGGESSSGMIINADTAMRITTVNACVRILAESIGSLPFPIYKRLDSGGRARATNHPLGKLLSVRPNIWQTSMEWREQMVAHLALRGNYFAVILRHGDDIVDDLIPIDPDRVEVLQLPDYSLAYEIHKSDGTRTTLPQSEVLHIRRLSTNGIRGRSIITDARDTFGAALATAEYGARLFRNNATPGVILEHPAKISNEAFARLRETWDERHAGSENAGKTAILEEGMKANKLSMTADDAQFLETIQAQRSQIAGLFGIPLFLLSFNENIATYASSEQFMLSFVQHTIRPWLVRIEQAIHNQLFTAPSYYYPEFNIEGMLRGDQKTRYESYAQGINWGFLCPNEARERENMNAREGGDKFLEPQNMRPAGTYQEGGK